MLYVYHKACCPANSIDMHGRDIERDLPNYAIQFRKSFIVYPCLVYLLQLMEGKSASLCEFWKHPPTDTA